MTTSRSGPACVSSQRTIAITTSLSGGPLNTSTEKISRWPNDRDFPEQIWSTNGHDVLFLISSVGHPMNEKMKGIYSNLPRSNCKQKCSGFPPHKMNHRTICLSGNAVMTNTDSERKRKTLLPFYFKRDICLYYALLDMALIYIVNVLKKKILKSLQQ